MARRAPLVWRLLLPLLVAQPLAAQQPPDSLLVRGSPSLLKYGKWAVLASAVAMGIKAAAAHRDADRAWNRLEDYCSVVTSRCDQGPGGDYLDPVSEGYYQTSITRDRHARGWLVGGEAALLGAAGLFVWELSRPKVPPRNIPFEPTMEVERHATRLGIAVPF